MRLTSSSVASGGHNASMHMKAGFWRDQQSSSSLPSRAAGKPRSRKISKVVVRPVS